MNSAYFTRISKIIAPYKNLWVVMASAHCQKYSMPLFLNDVLIKITGKWYQQKNYERSLQHKNGDCSGERKTRAGGRRYVGSFGLIAFPIPLVDTRAVGVVFIIMTLFCGRSFVAIITEPLLRIVQYTSCQKQPKQQ